MMICRPVFVATLVSLSMNPLSPHQAAAQDASSTQTPAATVDWAIALHGGVGGDPRRQSDEANAARVASLEQALRIGTTILSDGGTSLDAVEAVVRFLEDDPQFNAGRGAVFNSAGGHELDASIMDGRDKSCGAVGGVRRVKNPILLARRVMTETPHVFLMGEGAELFAASQNLELVEPSYFDTPAAREAWENQRRREADPNRRSTLQLQEADMGVSYGTVGCVARDGQGNLAAATSTGGITNKQFGRIGDTPIIGAGTYADNQTCAVSCTGIGEQFIRNNVAYDIAARMKYSSATLDSALDTILSDVLRQGDGGIIAVDSHGHISMKFNTPSMARAAADSSGRFDVIWHQPTSDGDR
jgi:beta-aspartyl-peptidase (threonine type)